MFSCSAFVFVKQEPIIALLIGPFWITFPWCRGLPFSWPPVLAMAIVMNVFSFILWRREWQPTSCLENPMDRGAWWAAVHGVTELGITEQLMLLLLIQKLRSPYVCGFFPSIWIYIWALPLPCSGSRFLCFSSSSDHHTSQGCFPLIHMTKWIDCLCLWRNYPTPPLSLHSLSLPVFFLSFMHYRQILYCLNHQGSPYQISGTLYFPWNFSYNIPLGISWPWVRQTWYC